MVGQLLGEAVVKMAEPSRAFNARTLACAEHGRDVPMSRVLEIIRFGDANDNNDVTPRTNTSLPQPQAKTNSSSFSIPI